MPAKNHLHTYRRIPGESGKPRFSCTDPECSHVALKATLQGKKAICPYCGNEHILTLSKLRLALPHCGCLKKEAPDTISASTPDTLSVAEGILGKLLKTEGESDEN